MRMLFLPNGHPTIGLKEVVGFQATDDQCLKNKSVILVAFLQEFLKLLRRFRQVHVLCLDKKILKLDLLDHPVLFSGQLEMIASSIELAQAPTSSSHEEMDFSVRGPLLDA